jgi:serine phosphatase RsbU (regulator of sigma subunit)
VPALSVVEVKGDKMPIAIYDRMDDFTNHELQLHTGDCLYLMSDGYEDQFGGPNHKKFLSKNLKQLLKDNCKLPMSEQKEILEKTLINWMGADINLQEQIDDITILGIGL